MAKPEVMFKGLWRARQIGPKNVLLKKNAKKKKLQARNSHHFIHSQYSSRDNVCPWLRNWIQIFLISNLSTATKYSLRVVPVQHLLIFWTDFWTLSLLKVCCFQCVVFSSANSSHLFQLIKWILQAEENYMDPAHHQIQCSASMCYGDICTFWIVLGNHHTCTDIWKDHNDCCKNNCCRCRWSFQFPSKVGQSIACFGY